MNRLTYDPYAKGRYYRAFVESDGVAKLTEKDIEGMDLVDDSIAMPAGFHVVDYIIDFNALAGSAPVDFWKGITILADGRQAVHIPEGTAYDYAHVFIFGYFD